MGKDDPKPKSVSRAVSMPDTRGAALKKVHRQIAIKKVAANVAAIKKAASTTLAEDGREYAEIRSDVFTVEGSQVAKAGDRFNSKLIERALEDRNASDTLATEMVRTRLYKDLQEILAKPAHAAVFGKVRRQYDITGTLKELPVNRLLLAEMSNLYRKAPWAYEQALVSASLTVLCLRQIAQDDPRLGQIWIALASRDIGLPRVQPAILGSKAKLKPEDFNDYLNHEVYSAVLLSRALGPSLAVRVALQHHLASTPGRWHPEVEGFAENEVQHILQLLGVVDAFAAMTAPRSFRPTPYSVRGALDQLIGGARLGWYDVNAVALLTAHCRKEFSLEKLRVSTRRDGEVPKENYFGIG